MPTLKWNKHYWDGGYDWTGKGEEWSNAWGSSEAQWFGSIHPRIHRYLPGRRVLEIAPGYGRWTNYLLRYCLDSYQGVDMSDECIAYCQEAFRNVDNASFSVNDGLNLDAVEDRSIDFLFSFDSLVHAEINVHESYIPQMLAKLNDEGVAFIHHSNWASASETKPNTHARAESVSAERVAEIIERCGGHVYLQECLNWGTDALIDAFSVFSRRPNADNVGPTIVRNNRFMIEAEIIRSVHLAYCATTPS